MRRLFSKNSGQFSSSSESAITNHGANLKSSDLVMNITERKLKLSCPSRSSLFAQIWQNLPYMARMGVISTSRNGGVIELICRFPAARKLFSYFQVLAEQFKEIMIGGFFVYNHKGEVLISRVYRDDIG